MKILVTGGFGMVGTELRKQLTAKSLFTGHNKLPTLDVSDYTDARKIVLSYKPDIIIHLAAETDVDQCEENPEECYNLNVKGTENIAKIAKEIDAILVYPSTFYVYSGEKNGSYDDRIDQPELNKIIGVYAKSKFLGEEIVRANLKRYFILRFGALFGGGLKDKKFVRKVLDLIKTEKEIRMVSDRITQPSSIKDTVNNLIHLIKTDRYGTYNMVGHGTASYFEYAEAIVQYSGKTSIKIIPIKSTEFVEGAPRPKNLSAINGRLQDIGLDLMRNWKISLKDYIDELKEKNLI